VKDERKMRIISAVSCLLLLTLLVRPAAACKCQGETTVRAAVQHAQVVASGRVISRLVTANLKPYGIVITGDTTSWAYHAMKFSVAVYRLKVDKIYKGEIVADTLTILTPANGAGCGVRFEVGERYIVYATVMDEMAHSSAVRRVSTGGRAYWTHQCTRTSEWFAEEAKALRVLSRK
jgi:prolyl-tRNA synthetase